MDSVCETPNQLCVGGGEHPLTVAGEPISSTFNSDAVLVEQSKLIVVQEGGLQVFPSSKTRPETNTRSGSGHIPDESGVQSFDSTLEQLNYLRLFSKIAKEYNVGEKKEVVEVKQITDKDEKVELKADNKEQVQIELIKPEVAVWDGIHNNNNDSFKMWLDSLDNEDKNKDKNTLQPQKKLDLEAKHPQYNSPLLYHASRANNLEAVKLLLEKKANINSQESLFRSTPLHIASFLGHVNLIRHLLENKASPYVRNRNGETSIENGTEGKNPQGVIPIFKEYCKNNPSEFLEPPHDEGNAVSLAFLANQSQIKEDNVVSLNSLANESLKNESLSSMHSFPLPSTPMLVETSGIPILTAPEYFPQDLESLWQLGICYANGSHGFEKDFTKAYSLFQQGTALGHVNSINNLGYCYFNGEGVTKNYLEAVRLYKLAASKGNVFAAYNLGMLYKNGKILKKDLHSAHACFKMAADQGHALAQYNVGKLYYSGYGCAQNITEAIRYWKLAEIQGEENSKKALAQLAPIFQPSPQATTQLPQPQPQPQPFTNLDTFKRTCFSIPGATLIGDKLEINLNIVPLIDLFRIFNVNDKCDPCKLTLKTFSTLHRQCKTCNQTLLSSSTLHMHKEDSSTLSTPTIDSSFSVTTIPPTNYNIPVSNTSSSSSFSFDGPNALTNSNNVFSKSPSLADSYNVSSNSSKISLNMQKQFNYKLSSASPPTLLLQTLDQTPVSEKQKKTRKVSQQQPYETLESWFSSVSKQKWETRLFTGIQMGKAMKKYYSNNGLHGNICAKNFIFKNNTWHLIKDSEKIIVEPDWCAPELVLIKNQSSLKADVFSFAFLLFTLWNEETPWIELSRKNKCDKICLSERPEFSNTIPAPEKYKELIEKCWHQESKHRPSLHYILQELNTISANITPELEALLLICNLPQGLEKYRIVKFIDSTFTCLIEDKSNRKRYAMKIRQKLNHISDYEEEHKILLEVCSSCSQLVPFEEGFLWDFQGDWGLKWCLVYNYYELGNLYGYIALAKERNSLTGKGMQEDEKQIIDWMLQLSEGLSFLHDNDIIHRNVKSSKIFLDCNNRLKIGDIGLTKTLEEEESKQLTKRNNIESLGIILLELLTLDLGITKIGWRNYLDCIPKEYSLKSWQSILEKIFDNNKKNFVLSTFALSLQEIQNSLKHENKEQLGFENSASLDGEKKINFNFNNQNQASNLASSYYVCRWCSRAFVDSSSLQRHEKKSHSRSV